MLLLAIGLQFVKVLYNPDRLAFYDEFSHWRTAIDISTSGHLFLPNPLQPVSPYYPGLEAITTVFGELTGFPLDRAGMIIIGLGRLQLAVALF
ncbi:MAG: hypothetical protein M3O95_07115, partial [Candidatus Dormibacteraeota bacterium]|nr:hypothetical protein [Candidatus Dormibacteraeota bacterium]